MKTGTFRRWLRGAEIVLSLISFALVYSSPTPGAIAQIENLGLIMMSCWAYTLAALGADLLDVGQKLPDTWPLMEFALDFLFVVLSMGGGVTTFVKCNQTFDGRTPFCADNSPYIDRPATIHMAATCAVLTCLGLSASLMIDYNAWLQTHLKYDEYEDSKL
uniref:MARVEL domain-containing protein n=1 Tax=Lotharella globosa TaxID=91324 RepID=A0A7S4DVE6_9EUKA|mmetsp:Transcript_14253/g.28747  ORF Transcript_14253/g.28747 Transcript_14253/m.28747 type:complete len:161 (-) Transcript_14253:287-769(-)